VYASPLSTFYLSGGVYPQGSFTIWREGSYYYAKNAYGFIQVTSNNFTYLWNTCLDAFPAYGGTILLKAGYYLGYIIIDRDGVIVKGEGCYGTQVDLQSEPPPTALYGTVIKPPEGKNAIEITDWGEGKWKYGIQIKDLGIWFDGLSTTGHGITTGTPYNKTTVTNLVVENIKVLGHDKNHYALQLCNFLYSTFKNILAWGRGTPRNFRKFRMVSSRKQHF